MATGDLSFARFPITLDLDAAADTVAQIGIVDGLFLVAGFDSITAKILPITGASGKSKAVVFVIGREIP